MSKLYRLQGEFKGTRLAATRWLNPLGGYGSFMCTVPKRLMNILYLLLENYVGFLFSNRGLDCKHFLSVLLLHVDPYGCHIGGVDDSNQLR